MGGRVLVLGATGMLGNAVFRVFDAAPDWTAYATVRSDTARQALPEAGDRLISGVNVLNDGDLGRAFAAARPTLTVNCVGVIKQLGEAKDPLVTIPINAVLPHRLAKLCAETGSRLIHVSTDCVFSGARGLYTEEDFPDADDLYGRSKLLGEVDYPHAITLRTSIIGHELNSAFGLIGWFLSQSGSVRGFRKAVFSGLPTVTLARLMRDAVAPRSDLHGLYHVSAEPIDKYALLTLVKAAYGKDIEIVPDDGLVIDRSLRSDRFRAATGFTPSPWPDLVAEMRAFG